MAESTIGWLHPPPGNRPAPAGTPGVIGYTVNFWIGCAKHDAGCKHCYAERRAKRHLLPIFREAAAVGLPVWGVDAPRHFTDPVKLRRDIDRWNREAAEALEPRMVFGGSQNDWLEDREDLVEARAHLIAAIEATPALRWVMLTKRPGNFAKLVPRWQEHGTPSNVWFGISASDQQTLDDKLPAFEAVNARHKLISGEPLIAEVDWRRALRIPGMMWLILGGESESAAKARPCFVSAIESGVRQARDAGRAVIVKQLGSFPVGVPSCPGCEGDMFEGSICQFCGDEVELVLLSKSGQVVDDREAAGDGATYHRVLHLTHKKGELPGEWPPGCQVQEWPTGARYVFGGAA